MFEMVRAALFGMIIGTLLCGCAGARVKEPSREEVLDRILPSAVQVVVEQQEGRRVRTGSGVVLASRRTDGQTDCFILTSGHTVSDIAGRKGVFVVFGRDRGSVQKVAATVTAFRETADLDLALLESKGGQCLPVQAGRQPLLGEAIWVVGFPWGRHMTLASGIVSQINLEDGADRETGSRLMVDASVSYGSSGGGVYTARDGGLIGIVEGYSTARVSAQGANPPWYIDVPVPGQTYVTPLSEVRRFLTEIGYVHLLDGGTGRIPPASASAGER
jgi:S1-C subfamily serine protease